MATSVNSYRVKDHFAGKAPSVKATYESVLQAAKQFGSIQEDPKKTSIHLVRNRGDDRRRRSWNCQVAHSFRRGPVPAGRDAAARSRRQDCRGPGLFEGPRRAGAAAEHLRRGSARSQKKMNGQVGPCQAWPSFGPARLLRDLRRR